MTATDDPAITRARAAARALREAIVATRADWERMPFFVRPMVRAGFEKRTGHGADAWLRSIDELLRALDGESEAARRAVAARRELPAALERLAEHYRSAPERAGRVMGGSRLDEVRHSAANRETAVRELEAALRAIRD